MEQLPEEIEQQIQKEAEEIAYRCFLHKSIQWFRVYETIKNTCRKHYQEKQQLEAEIDRSATEYNRRIEVLRGEIAELKAANQFHESNQLISPIEEITELRSEIENINQYDYSLKKYPDPQKSDFRYKEWDGFLKGAIWMKESIINLLKQTNNKP